MNKIQYAEKKAKVAHETYDAMERNVILPDRLPKLADIVAMFVQGRPIDASLQRHLDYNDCEYNPVLQKGLDLADLARIAKEVDMTMAQVQQEIEQAKLARQSKQDVLNDPSVKAPEQVSND